MYCSLTVAHFVFWALNVSLSIFFPQRWCSPMTSMRVQKPCSADTSMTQQQTRTLPRGSGVRLSSLPSSFTEIDPASLQHPSASHILSLFMCFANEVIGIGIFGCVFSWLHCMRLCSLPTFDGLDCVCVCVVETTQLTQSKDSFPQKFKGVKCGCLRLQRRLKCLESVKCPTLTVSTRVSVQEKHGDLEETVAETDPMAGDVWPSYRNADRKQNQSDNSFVQSVAKTEHKHGINCIKLHRETYQKNSPKHWITQCRCICFLEQYFGNQTLLPTLAFSL